MINVRLVVVQGRPEGAEIPLPMPTFLIGRDPQCQLRPASDLISKRHCAIVQRKEGVFVRDLGSTNGTFVNNDRIQGEVHVKDGDLLRVGSLVFAIKVHSSVPVTGPQSADEDERAVTWLLDYSAGTPHEAGDLGSKTTVMDMGSPSRSTDAAGEEKKAEPATKEADKPAKPAKPEDAPKSRSATAEVAGDLLEKLLSPQRKKKR